MMNGVGVCLVWFGLARLVRRRLSCNITIRKQASDQASPLIGPHPPGANAIGGEQSRRPETLETQPGQGRQSFYKCYCPRSSL